MKKFDVLVIGAGPAGIFTALELNKQNPNCKILIIDKGRNIEKRVCPERTQGYCSQCAVCGITSGWSGAGAFSDGKLSLSPEVGGRITEYMSQQEAQDLINYADQYYLNFGASPDVYGLNNQVIDDISYEASKYDIKLIPCPVRHLGTEHAYQVLKAMYHFLIEKENIHFWELTKAEELIIEDGVAKGAIVNKKGVQEEIFAEYVVVAPGRGGAEWLKEQTDKLGIVTENNEVDIGVRVEVPNSIMDHLTKDLYEAKLVYYSDTFDNKVRTFCMNPGGVVSGEHYDGEVAVVNGHSYADPKLKTQNTNFALLVSTRFTEPFNQPIEYGKYIARLANMLTGGGIMVQRLGDLIKGRRTDYDRLKKSTTIPTMKGAVPGDLSYALPQRYLTSIIEALKAFDNVAPGLYSRNTLLYGVEVKFYSSKVRVNDKFETQIKNLYTIGDGAGITRGLMQASVTGVVVARDILSKE
ncbi:MAG: NAD(P)/FAD-dependent oxidoreductase [Clostridia bacterium]|mgnify:CR=1 FL=1|nr:NAD(P)/FAD-dependent oxidoreductase [Clostridia bacterium]